MDTLETSMARERAFGEGMNTAPTNRTLPLAVRLALERLDDIETAIAASIGRFADTVDSELCSACQAAPMPSEGVAGEAGTVPGGRSRCQVTAPCP